ncbi:hypothetical protein SNEBB_003726 [Seison nebaliae]|nr:hypothetical protein SNEBB_003726 [Seison nebaliae]
MIEIINDRLEKIKLNFVLVTLFHDSKWKLEEILKILKLEKNYVTFNEGMCSMSSETSRCILPSYDSKENIEKLKESLNELIGLNKKELLIYNLNHFFDCEEEEMNNRFLSNLKKLTNKKNLTIYLSIEINGIISPYLFDQLGRMSNIILEIGRKDDYSEVKWQMTPTIKSFHFQYNERIVFDVNGKMERKEIERKVEKKLRMEDIFKDQKFKLELNEEEKLSRQLVQQSFMNELQAQSRMGTCHKVFYEENDDDDDDDDEDDIMELIDDDEEI